MDDVDVVNALLSAIKVPLRITSVRECVTSLFIALYEGLFEIRIPGIERGPAASSAGTRISNVGRLLMALEKSLGRGTSLSHISARGVVDQRETDLGNLIEVFAGIGWAMGLLPELPFEVGEDGSEGEADVGEEESLKTEAGSTVAPAERSASPEGSNAAFSSTGRPMRTTRLRPGDRAVDVADDVEHFARAREPEFNDYPSIPRVRPASSFLTPSRIIGHHSRRRIRFNMNAVPSPGNVNPLLRILPTDTPHTRALKMRALAIMREKVEVSGRMSNLPQPPEELDYSSFFRLPRDGSMSRVGRLSVTGSDGVDEGESGDWTEDDLAPEPFFDADDSDEEHASLQTGGVRDRRRPASLSDLNEETLESSVRSTLGVDRIKRSTRELMRKKLVEDRRRALDRRALISSSKQKVVSTYNDPRPLKVFSKEIETQQRSQRRQAEREALREATNEVSEQKRRVVRMEQKRRDAEKEVAAIERRRQLKEEKIVDDLYREYLANQREITREVLRQQKEARRAAEATEKRRREAREVYNRDQVELLERQLQEARKEETIILKAQAEEIRKLKREQKAMAKDNIVRAKQKLEFDEFDFDLQKEAAEQLRRDLLFTVS
ncbi:hypothetical protein HK101_011587 [Irineochytrium annulatum]|nr:hypothetical protein HK101_011587 [Irineochytrium annulatum]